MGLTYCRGRQIRPVRDACIPLDAEVLKYRVLRVSMFGIVVLVLDRYLIVGYLDPWGLWFLEAGSGKLTSCTVLELVRRSFVWSP